jgi:hypothetical protein
MGKNRGGCQTAATPPPDRMAFEAKNALEGQNALAFLEFCYGTIIADCWSPAL